MTRNNEGNGHEDGLPIPEEPFREVLHEAWREVLGQTLAEERAGWECERKRIEAEAGEIIARLRAEIAELRSESELRLIEKLAALRDGRDGADGAPGAPGPPGPRGEQGALGQLRSCHNWVADAVHYSGEVVCHQGSTWQARCDTAAEPGSGTDNWLCLARAGTTPRIRGTPGALMQNTECLISLLVMAGHTSRARTIRPRAQVKIGRQSRCPASADTRGLQGSAARRARGGRRVSRRRLSSAGLSKGPATAWFRSRPTARRGPASN